MGSLGHLITGFADEVWVVDLARKERKLRGILKYAILTVT
jgi:hypothetical protein